MSLDLLTIYQAKCKLQQCYERSLEVITFLIRFQVSGNKWFFFNNIIVIISKSASKAPGGAPVNMSVK